FDSDGDALSYSWQMIEWSGTRPGITPLRDGSRAAFVPNAVGAYQVRLTVTSRGALSSFDDVIIHASQGNNPKNIVCGLVQSSGGFSPDVWYECDGVRVTQVTSPFFSHIESFTGPTPQKQVVWVLVDGFPLATEVGLYANCAGPPLPPTLIANTFPHSS